MYRGRGAGQVVNLIDFEQDGIDNIVADQLKVAFGEQVRNILLCAREEVVKADDLQSTRRSTPGVREYGSQASHAQRVRMLGDAAQHSKSPRQLLAQSTMVTCANTATIAASAASRCDLQSRRQGPCALQLCGSEMMLTLGSSSYTGGRCSEHTSRSNAHDRRAEPGSRRDEIPRSPLLQSPGTWCALHEASCAPTFRIRGRQPTLT